MWWRREGSRPWKSAPAGEENIHSWGASHGVSEPKQGEEGIHTEEESAEEGRREDWSSSRSID